ncbi:MAG: hypothetical protein A2846_02025 [Candidatus Doudnabacteria bacterium RIFCSPHIGHO2_01_FULL_49_9]|uniref:SET domain-containing protein n=1 Tax=Candidatus Doudnabacteria bacterium RIFCSPHIGHO2_01_FULL_49_9 TaxID=1817827 RepID=A0A1F5P387_9BACT|nr:MAG: hypothetical protein A2846_02025 [Candidatus Doudnabacteria bacterium RIFCSPHIGHO2_01_FULL_49_9]
MKIELRDTKNGKGVFATKEFILGEVVIEFTGKIFKGDELPDPYNNVVDHYIQVGVNEYIGPSGKLDDFINHSCSPNAGLFFTDKGIFLKTINKIGAGEEITFDYSTTMLDDDWTMKCDCGSNKCRKIIKEFRFLPEETKERYIQLGIVPNYVLIKQQ